MRHFNLIRFLKTWVAHPCVCGLYPVLCVCHVLDNNLSSYCYRLLTEKKA